MQRAALYARFSSEDRQNARSIDDQLAGLHELCAREGFSVTEVFTDRGISGAAAVNRHGFQAMMRAAAARAFDVIVTEDIDRFIRDQGDYHAARKTLDFHGIAIVTLAGKVGRLDGSLRALMSEMFLENLATHTRRGMEGVIRAGRHAGGRAYGYRATAGKPGELAIVTAEADVVREIFTRYVKGETPRAIAAALNARAVPPPRGARWNASTINGNRARGSGLLLNDLYAGRIVWNRIAMIKNPATGKRVSRPNPPERHRHAAAEHLRIVDDETWQAAQAVKDARTKAGVNGTRKPRRLLSGLLRCGSCGAGMTSTGRDGGRLTCSRHRESGACANGRKVARARVEAAVIDGLRRNLADPALIAEYAAEYNRERARLARGSAGRRDRLAREAGVNARALARAVDAIVIEGVDPRTMVPRIKQLEAERDRLAAELATLAADAAPPISLHPAAIHAYRDDVAELATLIDDNREGDGDELIAAVRRLIEAVVVHAPAGTTALRIEIRGRLAELIGAPVFPASCVGSMVAGGRLHRSYPTAIGPLFVLDIAA